MKLTIITTVTNPEKRYDPWKESLACYCDLADEVIVINGGEPIDFTVIPQHEKIKYIDYFWPEAWSWSELPLHLNKGLQYATGDWVIKMDIDHMFHQDDFIKIRFALQLTDKPIATFQKFSIYPNRKLFEKGESVLAINKGRYHDSIKYGNDLRESTDLCFPIWHDGNDFDHENVPIGKLIFKNQGLRTGIKFFNFDFTFKPKEFVRKEFFRSSRAYRRYFHEGGWGMNEDEAFERFIQQAIERCDLSQYRINDIGILPKYIHDRYKNMTDDLFGLNGWGLI